MSRYAPSPRQVLWGVLGAFVLMLLFVLLGYALTKVPNPNQIALQQSTLIYYSDGKSLLAHTGDTNRTNVPLSRVPDGVQKAVLSAEDRNFEHEAGISPTGIQRAVWVDLKGGEVQGGSTITQQYVKNAYLTQERTFTRKFKEIFISLKLGNSRPKPQILRDYLNTIYFGRNAYGIQAASKAYFNKDVSKLSVAEGAVLAAVIRGPSLYDPTLHKSAAVARWHYVIDGMVKKGWLSAADAAKLSFPDVQQQSGHSAAQGDCVGSKFFICQAVKDELDKEGFGEERLALGGYRVITTIDAKAQRAAAQSMNEHSATYRESGADKGREAALVSVQPGDGAIRAMYGGGGPGTSGCGSHPDDCTDLTGVIGRFGGGDYKRSPGSSFKPYTLIAALQDGISLDSRFPGPAHIDFPGTGGKGISNSEGESCGQCTLTEALAKSINTIFVPLAQKVGPDNVAQAAEDAGIPKARIPAADEVPALTLGTADVAPLDQAVGYATIAAQGVYAEPYLVASIKTSSGHTVFKAKKSTKRVFPADVMADTTYAMTKVLTDGTAAGKGLAGRPAAGKTGTNGEIGGNHDAWFVGFTPQLSTAVWYGNTNAKKFVTDGGGPMYGGGLPALTWQQMMNGALVGKPVESFPPPAHVGNAINPAPTETSKSESPSASPSASPTQTTPTQAPTVTVAPSTPPAVTPTPTPSGTSTSAAGASPKSTTGPG